VNSKHRTELSERDIHLNTNMLSSFTDPTMFKTDMVLFITDTQKNEINAPQAVKLLK